MSKKPMVCAECGQLGGELIYFSVTDKYLCVDCAAELGVETSSTCPECGDTRSSDVFGRCKKCGYRS